MLNNKFQKIYKQIILEEIVTKDLVNFRKKLYDDENYRLKCVQKLNNLKENTNDDIKQYINALIPWLQNQKQFKSPRSKTKILKYLRAIMKLQNGKPFLEKLINNQSVTKQDNKSESKDSNQDVNLQEFANLLSECAGDQYKTLFKKYKNNKKIFRIIQQLNFQLTHDADSDIILQCLTILNKDNDGKALIKELYKAALKYKKQLQN